MLYPLIIKGAIYKDGDELVRPQFTGEFVMVDCTEYKTLENIKLEYDEDFAENVFENSPVISHDEVIYYECEYSPHNTSEFELLSDLDSLDYYDEENQF